MFLTSLREYCILFSQIAIVLAIVLIVGCLGILSYCLILTVSRIVQVHLLHTDGYDQLPRPKHLSKFWWPIVGDLSRIQEFYPSQKHLDWTRELGTGVYVYRGLLYKRHLILSDPLAINYILS